MTALTIDVDDRMMDALRETAARPHTTVEAAVRATPSAAPERSAAARRSRERAARAGSSFEAGRTWDRQETPAGDLPYTEDLNHGQRYGSVLVQDPFRDL